MRNAFVEELGRLGDLDPRIVLLSGDIGNRLFDKFKAAHPLRFLNCGVAEQNMMGVAAGMAMSGLRPIAYTITPFVTTRCLEQIRTDVAYHDAPVTIVGVGAGLAYAGLGPTHHSCEDLAFLRAIPNIIVFAPADSLELKAGMRAILAQDRPAYIRIGKKGEPKVHSDVPKDFALGRALTIREGEGVCLMSTGNMLPETLHAADLLLEAGIRAEVLSFHTVKPLDAGRLAEVFSRFDTVVTIEEHSLIGGFGSAVAEWLVDNRVDAKGFLRIGTPDAFYKLAGEQHYARNSLGLSAKHIVGRILTVRG